MTKRGFQKSGFLLGHMGGCHNYGPFLGTLNIRCRIIKGTQKGTIILTSTHMNYRISTPSRGYIEDYIAGYYRSY